MKPTLTKVLSRSCLLMVPLLLAAACGDGKKAGKAQIGSPTGTPTTTPQQFVNSAIPAPPDTAYSGPLFQLSYAWPTRLPTWQTTPPWAQVTGGGPVTTATALEYTLALKGYITQAVRQLLTYDKWNAGTAGWYNQPWLASIREPIHGMYMGSTFSAGTLAGQTAPITTYVLTYYDSVAAYTVGQVWGQNADQPTLANNAAQFAQNAVIIKLAFQTGGPIVFPAMQNTATWQIYAPNQSIPGDTLVPQLQTVYLMQADMIVKDTVAAPNTGWVFTTLVYDANAPGKDPWDRMVPLGAMWGNDPEATQATDPLQETVINPAAPAYSKSTLGWGGRLSGPNDGAVALASFNNDTATIAASSCMSCHGVAETPMQSFLLPSPPTASPSGTLLPNPSSGADNSLAVYPPGSPEWMLWFRDRPGTVPQDSGTTALDYDMVFAFKSIPLWAQATAAAQSPQERTLVEVIRRFRQERQYHGMPPNLSPTQPQKQ